MSENAKLYPNYFKDVSHLDSVDVYRIIDLWALHHPALQHALKKVLVCGRRGPKDASKDAQEAIDALKRFIEMNNEDARKELRVASNPEPMPLQGYPASVPVEVTIDRAGIGQPSMKAESFKVDGVELASQGKAVELERIPVKRIVAAFDGRFQD